MVQQGFGCMGITFAYGTDMEEADGVKLIKDVFAQGVTHFDTAEVYRSSFDPSAPDLRFNETVVGKAANEIGREKVFIATKVFPQLHGGILTVENATASLDASLARLGMPYVDLWYLHRLPNDHDVTAFMTAAKAAVEAGKVKAVGLSEASSAKIKEAHAIHPVSYIQQEWSLLTRAGVEEHLLETVKELGISVVAYSPLARNLLAQVVTETPKDWRATLPRYTPEALAKNSELVKKVMQMGKEKGCTAAQLSLAWLLAKAKQLGVTVIPIPGTTKLPHAKDNIAAENVALTADEMAKLEEIGSSVEGERGDESYTKMSLEGQLGL